MLTISSTPEIFFYNKHSLRESDRAKDILMNALGERGGYAPISNALLKLVSAIFCYNSSLRFYTQSVVAMENSINGLIKKNRYRLTAFENKEIYGLIYTIFQLSGYRQLGEALAITWDLLDTVPGSMPKTLPNFKTAVRIFYDLTYLGLYFSPQGRSFTVFLKISKVAYFVFKEYLECSRSWSQIKTTIGKPSPANAIDLLTRGIHLYGNSLQLYTTGNAAFK